MTAGDRSTAKRSDRGDVTLQRIGDDLVFTVSRWDLVATFSRLRQRGDGLVGELLLEHGRVGRLFWGTVHLASVSSRKTIAQHLGSKVGPPGNGIPNWSELVDTLCFSAAQEFRTAGEVEEVGAADDAQGTDAFVISSLLLRGDLNMLYGAPGTAKGYVAVALALQMHAQVPVVPLAGPTEPHPALYLDWEWSKAELGQRLRALCRGAGVPHQTIFYRRMAGPLADQGDVLRTEMRRRGVRFIVVDSAQLAAGFAAEGDPGAAFGRLVEALRSFEVTALLIDHPAKGAERGTETPYGTRYKLALCRNIWVARRSHGDQRELHVGLWHDENSNVPPHPPIGLRLIFDRASWPDGPLRSLRIEREDVRDVPDFADLLTDWQRIERELARQPLHVKELAEVLDLSEVTVRVRLNEKRRKGLADRLPDGRWALIDRERQDG